MKINKMKSLLVNVKLFLGLILLSTALNGQSIVVQGFVFAENNTGYLNNAAVEAMTGENMIVQKATTDKEGKFEMELPAGKKYRIVANKQGFDQGEIEISTVGKKEDEKVFAKVPLKRAPGYIFEATLSELLPPDQQQPVDALTGCRIEIFNMTTKKEVLMLKNHDSHTFSFTFEKGNHYVLMIRKPGFFTKRLVANVDINDCILCFEGVGNIRPMVNDNLTVAGGHQSGVLGTDIKMKRIKVGEPIEVNNIYYDFGKSEIRPDAAMELDKLAGMLRDNPHLLIELGSHTDSRGLVHENQALSDKRAQSAVSYLIDKRVDRTRITPRGYGEDKLKNHCKSKVECTEDEHAVNRRTEFKVLGFLDDPFKDLNLRNILMDEAIDDLVSGVDDGGVYKAPAAGEDGIYQAPPAKEGDETAANDLLGGETETVAIPTGDVAVEGIERPGKVGEAVEEVVGKPVIGKGTAVDKAVEAAGEVVEEVVEKPAIGKGTVVETVVEAAGEVVEKVVGKPEIGKTIAAEAAGAVKEAAGLEIESPAAVILEEEVPAEEPVVIPPPNVGVLSASYTGYKIEILATDEEAKGDHPMFKQYGKIDIESDVDKKYHYLMGDFRNGNLAKTYMERSVSFRYPDAKVIQYQGGQRIKL